MNRTAQKHLDAIRAGEVTKTNVIGLRKLINATDRALSGYSTSVTACTVTFGELQEIRDALDEHRPRVTGALHDSGLALLKSPRYAKRMMHQRALIDRIASFHLVRLDEFNGQGNYVPIYQVRDASGSPLFTFRNISWQSGGNGPEIQGREF